MCMFRRLFISGLVLPALVSCSKTETGAVVSNTFRATISPEIVVRSGDASGVSVSVDHAVLEAWKGETREARQEIDVEAGTGIIVFSDVPLAAGFDYDIYIWADTKGAYETSDLRTVKLASDRGYDGTVEGRDAFCSCSTVHSQQNQAASSVTLRRPFARVDLILPEGTSSGTVKISAPAAFGLKEGTVSGVTQFSYDFNCTEKGTTTVSDLLFAGSEMTSLDYSFKIGDDDERTFTVPVKRNHKTIINVGTGATN